VIIRIRGPIERITKEHAGKHACPGRFFAGNELKAMMAHLLLKYDIRAEVEGVRPPNSNVGQSIMPNMAAKVLFRKRQT
jgi:cytochrome P450